MQYKVLLKILILLIKMVFRNKGLLYLSKVFVAINKNTAIKRKIHKFY